MPLIAPNDKSTTPDELAAEVRAAFADGSAIYPVGGGTALDFGLPIPSAGRRLSTGGLNRVIDFPARDLTITVEAGITMAALAATLAAEGLRLPVDAAQADRATLGGLLATNFSGPRRYGRGTLRDYLIGVSAVDGRGTRFNAGGRVVKNVAGYDFCKLLVGSLGTLGVIVQATLKVLPIPHASAFVSCAPRSFEQAESLLASLVTSTTAPTAIEWSGAVDAAAGVSSAGQLCIGFEGTPTEVDWQQQQLTAEWGSAGVDDLQTTSNAETADLWQRFTEFGCSPASGALLVKFSLPPSRVGELLRQLAQCSLPCVWQARAGTGVALVQFAEVPASGAAAFVVQQLRPLAAQCAGQLIVWRARQPEELTRQAWWGGGRDPQPWTAAVKEQFDPAGLLNPGRFFYGT